MLHKFSAVAFAVSLALLSNLAHASLPTSLKEDPDMQEIVALNYLSSTLFKLRHDNNKIALQQAYDEIFNNINLKRLPSNETLNKTKALMDQLTDMLLTEKIKEEIEQKRSEAFQNTLLINQIAK